MILNSPYITGSITVTGNANVQGTLTVTGSLSGTASLASNSNLLQGTGSVGFSTTASLLEVSSSQQQISSSLLQVSSSYISLSASYTTFSGSASTRITANSSSIQQVSSSQQQISASLLNVISIFATTGSNSFRANQSITGSLVVSSTITAQTLVVQTVTSSIVYSSGSNNFGSALGDRQTFTGSVNITGSLSVTGSAAFSSDVVLPYSKALAFNSISNQYITADSSNLYLGADNLARLTISSSGFVGIGTTSPNAKLHINGSTGSPTYRGFVYTYAGNETLTDEVLFQAVVDGYTSVYPLYLFRDQRTNQTSTQRIFEIQGGISGVGTILTTLANGYVGIGTTSPQASLHIAGKANTTALTIGASNGYEIFITGSDSANIYHASPNQAIYLNTNGGFLHLGTSAASTLLTISGSSVGIGTTSPTVKLDIRGGNFLLKGDVTDGGILTITRRYSTGAQTLNFNNNHPSTNLDWTGARITSADAGNYNGYLDFAVSLGSNNSEAAGTAAVASVMRLTKDGNVGIGTTSPARKLIIYGGTTNAGLEILSANGYRTAIIAGGASSGTGADQGYFQMTDQGTAKVVLNTAGDSYITGGNLGIGTSLPLATLSTIGGAVQFMGDYRNYQTIIKNAGGNGTFNGSLLITIPQMSDGNTDGYGGYSCEVYVAGYSGFYCHAWFGGYINGGITSSEATILRSNGGWSISQVSYGANNQGFQFTIDYPSSIVHPTARIIFNKGGSPNSAAYPANTITSAFS